MALGRSIRIYLDAGEVSGIRHAELVNWTGQALLCPRSRISQLTARWQSVVCRPGVYFLVGAEQPSAREVYIGEAEDALERLKTHLLQKEFWQEALIFTSKDENLTKAHVRYLESRLIERAKSVGRYVIQNGNQPAPAGLPRADIDAMEEFLQHVPLLLGVLGHRVLDGLTASPRVAFVYAIRSARAEGVVTDEGFVVLRAARRSKEHPTPLRPDTSPSKTSWWRKVNSWREVLFFSSPMTFFLAAQVPPRLSSTETTPTDELPGRHQTDAHSGTVKNPKADKRWPADGAPEIDSECGSPLGYRPASTGPAMESPEIAVLSISKVSRKTASTGPATPSPEIQIDRRGVPALLSSFNGAGDGVAGDPLRRDLVDL